MYFDVQKGSAMVLPTRQFGMIRKNLLDKYDDVILIEAIEFIVRIFQSRMTETRGKDTPIGN